MKKPKRNPNPPNRLPPDVLPDEVHITLSNDRWIHVVRRDSENPTTITHNLWETVPNVWKTGVNNAINGVQTLIANAYMQDIDVASPAFVAAIEKTLTDFRLDYED